MASPKRTKNYLRIAKIASILMVFAGLLASSAVLGQDSSPLIVSVKIEGATGEQAAVRTAIQSRVGSRLMPDKVTQDIKRIYDTGYFSEAEAKIEIVKPGEAVLIFQLTQRMTIVDVRLEGNKKVDNKDLLQVLTINNGSPYSIPLIERNKEALRIKYEQSGYAGTTVNVRVVKVSNSAVQVTFIFKETVKLYLTDIQIIGATVFHELALIRELNSSGVDCFSWLGPSGSYNYQLINSDLGVIRAQYFSKGYIDVFMRVEVKIVTGTFYSKAYVKIYVQEGLPYQVESTTLTEADTKDRDNLLQLITLKKDDPYNPLAENSDRLSLAQYYQDRGYAFAYTIANADINRETRRVKVVYQVTKGNLVYYGRIEFHGNRNTRDYVLRREMKIYEQQLSNNSDLRRSLINLERLGYFERGIRLDTDRNEQSSAIDLIFDVEEAQTGSVSGQFGYGSVSGFLIAGTLSKSNLFGLGQTGRLDVKLAQREITQTYSLSFLDPYLFGFPVSSQSQLSYDVRTDYTESAASTFNVFLINQSFGYTIYDDLSLSWGVRFELRKPDVPINEPLNLHSASLGLNYDTVDHPTFPSSGYRLSFNFTQYGGIVMRGDTEFREYAFDYRHFVTLNKSLNIIFMGHLNFSLIEKVGNNRIPLEKRYRLGGSNSVRGYEDNIIGGPGGILATSQNSISVPLTGYNGNIIYDSQGNVVYGKIDSRKIGLDAEEIGQIRSGGTSKRLLTLEVLIPIAGNNVRGVLGYDAGNVNSESSQYSLLGVKKTGFFDLKHSAVIGLRLITPLGVLRFEYARKLRDEPGQSPDRFDFTISSLF